MADHRTEAEYLASTGTDRDAMLSTAHGVLALIDEVRGLTEAIRAEASDPGIFDPRIRPNLASPCPVTPSAAAEWLRRVVADYHRGDLTDDDLKKRVVDASVALTGCPF